MTFSVNFGKNSFNSTAVNEHENANKDHNLIEWEKKFAISDTLSSKDLQNRLTVNE